jgi:hypothetical protein
MNKEPKAIFREVQRFRQPWIWLLLLLCALLPIGLYGYGMVKQLVYGQPFGAHPMSDTELLTSGIPTILFGIGLIALFYWMNLAVIVYPDHLHIRFRPLHLKPVVIPWAEVTACKPRTYRPVLEYGGWGIRYGRGRKAYNVSGKQGVELQLANGRLLMIGSQRPDELAQAIESAMGQQGQS